MYYIHRIFIHHIPICVDLYEGKSKKKELYTVAVVASYTYGKEERKEEEKIIERKELCIKIEYHSYLQNTCPFRVVYHFFTFILDCIPHNSNALTLSLFPRV